MMRLAVTIRPSTWPLGRSSTRSVAVSLPLTVPRTVTVRAMTSELTLPYFAMANPWSGTMTLPSTRPSMIKCSLERISPLTKIVRPIDVRPSGRSGSGTGIRSSVGMVRVRSFFKSRTIHRSQHQVPLGVSVWQRVVCGLQRATGCSLGTRFRDAKNLALNVKINHLFRL